MQHQEVSLLIQLVLEPPACSLASLDSVLLITDLIRVVSYVFVIAGDTMVVLRDVLVVVGDAIVEVIDLVVKSDELLSYGLEGYHQACFHVESRLVLFLTSNLFPRIEVINLVPEVTSWYITIVLVNFSIVLVVSMPISIVMTIVILHGHSYCAKCRYEFEHLNYYS